MKGMISLKKCLITLGVALAACLILSAVLCSFTIRVPLTYRQACSLAHYDQYTLDPSEPQAFLLSQCDLPEASEAGGTLYTPRPGLEQSLYNCGDVSQIRQVYQTGSVLYVDYTANDGREITAAYFEDGSLSISIYDPKTDRYLFLDSRESQGCLYLNFREGIALFPIHT